MHQIHYFGWYSNKKRGMQNHRTIAYAATSESAAPVARKCRLTWAALIKAVYEVDPLTCPKCGGEIKIVSFLTNAPVVEKILRHCKL